MNALTAAPTLEAASRPWRDLPALGHPKGGIRYMDAIHSSRTSAQIAFAHSKPELPGTTPDQHHRSLLAR